MPLELKAADIFVNPQERGDPRSLCLVFYSNYFTAEKRIMDTLERISTVPVAQIENVVTANNICSCRNPLERAFEVTPKVKDKPLN